jgi:AcrR family transcriptional regulator
MSPALVAFEGPSPTGDFPGSCGGEYKRGTPRLQTTERVAVTEPSELKRSDARRNRDAILAAALVALTESPDASLNAIAKRAGVANATLYRHFPTRAELVLATYEREVGKLVDAAEVLLRKQAPIDALQSWVERLARYAVTKHGLADALRKATSPGNDLASTETYDAIVGALDRLLQANISAGNLRPDLDAEDVILALAGLWQLDPASDWKAQAHRIYDIVLSGLQRST